jgi:hypothetical protein
LWGVIFDHDGNCTAPASAAAGAAAAASKMRASASGMYASGGGGGAEAWGGEPPVPVSGYQVVQGLELVWADEISDVMLLQLNNEIPEGAQWEKAKRFLSSPRGLLAAPPLASERARPAWQGPRPPGTPLQLARKAAIFPLPPRPARR